MPLYLLECDCGNIEEKFLTFEEYDQNINEQNKLEFNCSICSKKMHQCYNQFNFQLRGKCWSYDSYK